jgi:hypothetical protein
MFECLWIHHYKLISATIDDNHVGEIIKIYY